MALSNCYEQVLLLIVGIVRFMVSFLMDEEDFQFRINFYILCSDSYWEELKGSMWRFLVCRLCCTLKLMAIFIL